MQTIDNIDSSDSLFLVDRSCGDIRLVFTTMDTLIRPGPKEPLWWLALPDEDHLSAMTAWVGERQDAWPEWRSIHAEFGAEGLSEHIATLWGEGVERCASIMVQRCEDDDRAIEVSAMLPYRRPVIARHVFKTAGQRDAFYRWLHDRDMLVKSNELFDVACLQGRAVLASGLDRIAAQHLAIRSRRKGRRRAA